MVEIAEGGNVEVRAKCATALRVHVARLVSNPDAEPSEEADAGAILDARSAQHVHELREALPELVKALAARGG
jgi:hypothetical protein